MPQTDLVIYDKKLELDSGSTRFSFHETGLEIADDISFDEWQVAVETLAQLEKRSTLMFAWNWGGLIARGSKKWGKYDEALKATGLSMSTLKIYKWVEGATPREARGIPNLNFTHYLKVAKIKDFDNKLWLLLQASENGWHAEGPEYASAIKLLILADQNKTETYQTRKEDQDPSETPPKREWLPLATPGDEVYELTQKQRTLESENGALILTHGWYADQAERAIGLLSLLDGLDSQVREVVSEVVEILSAIPNNHALTLVTQVVSQFEQGDTTAMVDSLSQLAEIMEGVTTAVDEKYVMGKSPLTKGKKED